MPQELDNVDRGILYLLQRDARNTTAQEIADTVGVSASTIRNRINRLESDGVIRGYHPEINYEEANLPLRILFVCTAPATDRSHLAEKVMEVQGVIDMREMMTGRRNVQIEVVGTNTRDITRITDAIHELGLQIESSELIKRRRIQPFNHFHFSGSDDGSDDESAADESS